MKRNREKHLKMKVKLLKLTDKLRMI